MSEAPELLPCLYCGHAAVETRPKDVSCSNNDCWLFYKTRHVTRDEWNTRPDLSDAKDKRIAELEATIENLTAHIRVDP